DGTRIDPARACQGNAALRQRCRRELVGAGADRLDEAQPRRAVEKLVPPQPGDHQHIGLADAVYQALGVADRKAADAGRTRRKPLVQLIGDMGKADREPIVGREHRRALRGRTERRSGAASRLAFTRIRITPSRPRWSQNMARVHSNRSLWDPNLMRRSTSATA